jgi:hypothetical protein
MLHGIHTEKAIVVWAVVAMKIVVRVLEVQEGHVCLGTSPTNRRASNRIVQSVLMVSPLCDQATPPVFGIELTLTALPTAGLQVALKVCVPEVPTLVIWQQVLRLMGMK